MALQKLTIVKETPAQKAVNSLYVEFYRRLNASPQGTCPVDLASAFVNLCHSQSCGKCTPCRIGLGKLKQIIDKILAGKGTEFDLTNLERNAAAIADSADCAIGYEAAAMVLEGVRGFREDYEEHAHNGRCICSLKQPVPCVTTCPAHVDIPGYIALVREGRFDDAVDLIRKDNPFPYSCAYVCEHPCERQCRRRLVDDAVNICGLKRYAVDHCTRTAPPPAAPATGKRVAVVGGGPSGLTAAYYLSQMGHSVTVFEQREKLGGMLRYGIPDYRLPPDVLDHDIDYILAAGVEVKTGVCVGREVQVPDLQKDYDAVYVAIGAHADKKLGLEGEDSENVLSAVELLRNCGEGNAPDFTGKRVVVIGGGNVSMDATRTAIRLGAESVTCVYRRRVDDMTALPEEIEDALAEGCQILPLQAPHRIEADENGRVAALWTRPQIIGGYGRDGRPGPRNAAEKEFRIPADYIIIAIGQRIESDQFEKGGIETSHGALKADLSGYVPGTPNVFAGGDAVTGPATVIRAVAAGKVGAANIDAFLGFHHTIGTAVRIPPAKLSNTPPCGRIQPKSRNPLEARCDFQLATCGMTEEEAMQEASRCLRCDHFGYGIFKGGRTTQW